MNRLFNGSRIGGRVFGMFMLAAATPLLLLAVLSQGTVDAALRRSEATALKTSAKAAGMQTMERLRVARLAVGSDRKPVESSRPREMASPLLALVSVPKGGSPRAMYGADRAIALTTWIGLRGNSEDQGRDRLAVDRSRGPGAADIVIDAVNDAGERRVGLVNPAYLWEGADEMPPGLWLCVLDGTPSPLYCSDPAAAHQVSEPPGAASPALAHEKPEARWRLFVGADFRGSDWLFVAGRDTSRSDATADETRRLLPTVAAAGVLLAMMLSLVQIRRTLNPLNPLNRLVAGARELASRRSMSRLDVGSKDEFGELAVAFNEMAFRLEARFEEIESLAAIDGDIVAQRPLAGIVARIVARLGDVLPGASVMIAWIGPPAVGQAQVLRAGSTAPELQAVEIDVALLTRLAASPEALDCATDASMLPSLAPVLGNACLRVLALPLTWGERCFGFLAIGQSGSADAQPDADSMRQVVELKNRAAIAASAAERDQALRWQAHHDSLTGLLNRNGIEQALSSAIGNAGVENRSLALLLVDLDRFKAVNDGLGHAAGDSALVQVAQRLRDCVPEGAVIGRHAGDEFVIVFGHTGPGEAATALARTICEKLGQPILSGAEFVSVGASVGVVISSNRFESTQRLLRCADQAMYEAKRMGGGRYHVFEQKLDAKAERLAWIERELPMAASRGQLRLLYQPRVDRVSGRINSVEALLRWQHPVHGPCSPMEFIPVAERSELIEHIGRWVIDAACVQARQWRQLGISSLPIAVNLSSRQISSDRLLPDLQSAFARHAVPPSAIELEITESVFVEQTESTIARLHLLRSEGLIIALDDFGTGYSSMAYLRKLPLDILKIDRAFISDLGREPSALALAQAIVTLAQSLGMRTVAEGVETAEQLRVLSSLGCDEFQGYLFSRPVEPDSVFEMLRERPARHALLREACTV